MAKLYCKVLLFLLLGELTLASVWQSDDAIIVDDSDGPEGDDELSLDDPNRCVTSDGAVGTCIPAKLCFPHVYPETPEEDFFGKSSYLRDTVINFTEPCTPSEETTLTSDGKSSRPVRAGDETICCATIDRAIAAGVKFPTWQPKKEAIVEDPPEVSEYASRAACSYAPYTVNANVTEKLLIVGGQQVRIDRYPFMVAMFKNEDQLCGGSLIGPDTVLTAAHCVLPFKNKQAMKQLSLRLGVENLDATESGIEIRSIRRLVVHKGFHMAHFRDDVAIIKLDRPVKYTNRIRAACYSNCGSVSTAEVAGWGKTVDGGPTSPTLRAVELPIWTNAQCSSRYQQHPSRSPAIGPGMLCAGSRPSKDSCQGDSGGPLETRGCQIGIVSWGIGCGQYPGVYTRVSNYVSWIQKYHNQA